MLYLMYTLLLAIVTPKVLQGPQSISELQGTIANFNCSAYGIPPPNILWTFTNDSNEATALKSTRDGEESENVVGELDLFDVTEENFGTYSCVAVNIFGADTSSAATLVLKSSKYGIMIILVASMQWCSCFNATLLNNFIKPHNAFMNSCLSIIFFSYMHVAPFL